MSNAAKSQVIAVEDVTIALSGTVSGVINQLNKSVAAILFPSTFDGTAISFTGCDTEGGTFTAVIGADGNALAATVAASKVLALTDDLQMKLKAIPYLKIVAGTSQSGTDTVLKVFKR